MIKHRKIIICILLSYALFIVGIYDVKASGAEATGIEYNISSTGVVAPRRQVQGRYGFTTYSGMYCNQGTCTWPVQSIYGNAGTNSGRYFTYFMYASNEIVNVSANIQLVNGDYVSCNVDGTTNTGYVYNATCDLSNFESNITIYKYGFTFYQPNTLAYTSDYEISNLYYFNTSAENQQQINNINNSINNVNSSVNQVNDSINDDTIDTNNTSSSTTSWSNKNATNGTITQLLTLPISLLQAIVNGIQSSCSSFSLGSLFGTNITLPCINIGSLVGSALWSTIDILFSGFMILAIAKKLIKIFNDFTNLKTNQVDELYGGGK